MNNEEKILSMLMEMQKDIKELKEGQTKIDNKMSTLEDKMTALEKGQADIKDHLIQLDSKNADRHIAIIEKIDKLSQDLTVIEAVSGKNLADIAYLKSIK